MSGVSREASAQVHAYLDSVVAAGVEPVALGRELFTITGVLAGSASLRRALTDPARSSASRSDVVERLFAGKVSPAAVKVTGALAAVRWGAPSDLVDAAESLGVNAVLAAAEADGRLDDVEDELFRFSRIVAGDAGLRDALAARSDGSARKQALVERLLSTSAAPETVVLAVQAAVAPRGLRTEHVLERFVELAAARRRQLIAHVTAALPLTEAQRERLATALSAIYGRQIHVTVDLDPEIVGGLRVQVDGEIIDGSVASRLAETRRRIAG